MRLRLMPEKPDFPFMAWRQRGFAFSAVLMVASVILYLTISFAVTLGIGILSSVFTATMLTRMLIVLWMRRTRPQALPV